MSIRLQPVGWCFILPFTIGLGGCSPNPSVEQSPVATPMVVQPAATQVIETPKPQPPQLAGSFNPSAAPIVILGFDGVDPDWVREWMGAGLLPNLAKLAQVQDVIDLQPATPPQSPVCWSTFATGLQPGGHNIFDFLIRDPDTYLPVVAMGRLIKPVVDAQGLLKTPAAWEGGRAEFSFWSMLDRAGVKTLDLAIAYDFPPAHLDHGFEIAGLGTPDIRGTNSFFSAFVTDATGTKPIPVNGGQIVPITLQNGVAISELEGLYYEEDGASQKMSTLPAQFTLDLTAETVTVQLGDRSQTLTVHQWSDWYELNFPLSTETSIPAFCKVFVESLTPELRIYVSPRNMHPRAPMLPFATSTDRLGQLVDKYGLFKTVGWIHDTNAMRAGVLNEAAFLEDVYAGMDQRRRILLGALEEGAPPLLVAIFTFTDRIGHMFYRDFDPQHPGYDAERASRFGKAIPESYQRMDTVVGEVLQRLQPGTKLIILSDHGFHTYRYSFSINTWLFENGYLMVQGQRDAEDKDRVRSRLPNVEYLRGINWAKTRAYSVGLGQIYINLHGREKMGTVEPGADYQALVEELKEKLLAVTDPTTGEKIIANITTRDEAFQGTYYSIAPDLQIGYAPGYQTDRDSSRGAIPAQLITPNLDAWSGDHACSDWEQTYGFLMTNFSFPAEHPALVDVAPTVISHFGFQPPREMTGHIWTLDAQ